MVHEFEHCNVAPVVVVVADAAGGVRVAVHAVGRRHLALGHGGQPREDVLSLLAEEEISGRGPPRGQLPGQRDVEFDLVDLRVDGVGVQVAAERVLADLDVAALLRG